MPTIQVQELASRANEIVRELAATGERAIIVEDGRPLAVLSALTEDELEDYVLANDPEFVDDMHKADEAMRSRQTREARDVFAELD
jgi:antitoxin (DNA-binding transcriptional repressor) of toxin-antitoxin stability system